MHREAGSEREREREREASKQNSNHLNMIILEEKYEQTAIGLIPPAS